MAGKSDWLELAMLKLLLNGSGITGIADNTATSPLAQLQFALHLADPGEANSQSSNECTYPGYARVAVNRTAAALPCATTSGISAGQPASVISFPQATGGLQTATHWSVGVAGSGATNYLYAGVIGSALGAFTAGASSTITIPAHGRSVNDKILFASSASNVLPTGMTEGQIYYVVSVPTADALTVSATQGGSAIAFTGSGHGAAFFDVGIGISQGVTPQLSTATMIVED